MQHGASRVDGQPQPGGVRSCARGRGGHVSGRCQGAACAGPCRGGAASHRMRRGRGRSETPARPHSAGVVLVRQSGEGNCVLGRTWGFDAKGVWVADGCRATLRLPTIGPPLACAAAAGAREVCPANTSAGVALVGDTPGCALGRTWGYDRDGVWVADGCQGTFVLTTRGAVACGSDGPRQHCTADTSAGVVLARTTAPLPAVRAGQIPGATTRPASGWTRAVAPNSCLATQIQAGRRTRTSMPFSACSSRTAACVATSPVSTTKSRCRTTPRSSA